MNKVIVHIITKLELGGAQINTLETVKYLEKRGKDVYLICGVGGYFDGRVNNFCKNYFFCDKLKREINIFRDYKALVQIIKYLKEIKKRGKKIIVHTHSSKAGILGRIAGYLVRADTIIHTYHGFGFNDYQFWLKKFFFIFIEFIVSFITDEIIFVSKENRKSAIKYKLLRKRHRGLIIRSGIKLERIEREEELIRKLREEYKIGKGEFIIGTISCFKRQKNLCAVIEIGKLLKKEGVEFRWIIFGDGEEKGKFIRKIREAGLENNFILPGWDEKANIKIIICDIFVLVSLFEGLPRALLEAMSLGKSAVVSDIDGNRDVIKNNENGFLVKVNHYDEFKDRIKRIYYDKELRERIGKAAKETIKYEYSLEKMLRDLEELYEQY